MTRARLTMNVLISVSDDYRRRRCQWMEAYAVAERLGSLISQTELRYAVNAVESPFRIE